MFNYQLLDPKGNCIFFTWCDTDEQAIQSAKETGKLVPGNTLVKVISQP